jgi:hypothetical protein
MRKGIVATIVIYSLVQILGAVVVFTIVNHIIPPVVFMGRDIVIFGMYTLSYILGFILLARHINKKYTDNVRYWKYILIGVMISIILSICLSISNAFLIPSYDFSEWFSLFVETLIYLPIGFLITSTIICSAIGLVTIVYKK